MQREEALRRLNIEDDSGLTAAQLRKHYLKAALQAHPDKHPGDENATERFAALQEAHAFLLQRILDASQLQQERARSDEALQLFQRAIRGEDVEAELQAAGMYRPSELFGIDLTISFDRRRPQAGSCGEAPEDIHQAFVEAFRDEGLDEEGDPLEGWARPPAVLEEDL